MVRKVNVITGKPKMVLEEKPVEATVYEMALARLRDVYDRFDHVAVSFSGGKDSTACLQLTLEVARERGRTPLRVFFFDEEAIPYQTEEYVRRVAQMPDVALEWYCLPVKHRNACSRKSPWWWPWAPEARDLWVRPLPPEAITELAGFPNDPPAARLTIPDATGLLFDPLRHGNAAMVMGIRAQESMTRRRAVMRRAHDNYIIKNDQNLTARGNLYKVYPIYDWRTEDVWTAPATLDWDYNRAYDVLDQAGLSFSQQRCSPAYGEEPLQKLWTYAVCFPEVWDRMLDRVPGAAAAGRYATTELWGYGGKPEKPEGMSWPDFIAHYVAKFDPASQRQVAAHLKQKIQEHYNKTADPILPHAPHPHSGISWDWLLMVAMRGDFKSRKAPGARINHATIETYWEAYNAERAELEAKGEL